MNREYNRDQFEMLMGKINRPGVDKLMDYIRRSDFYTAPASSKFHLCCEGGLLQHSLNVYDALRFQLDYKPAGKDSEDGTWEYSAASHAIAGYSTETITIAALLHDICKTRFYSVEYRNQKVYKPDGRKSDSGGRYDWDRVPVYVVEDRNPYGHGEKSVMMISEFMHLTMEERYAIRWHMGYANESYNAVQSIGASIDKYPLVLLLQTADMIAAHFMEDKDDNKPKFRTGDDNLAETAENAAAYADNPILPEETESAEPVFMDATPL